MVNIHWINNKKRKNFKLMGVIIFILSMIASVYSGSLKTTTIYKYVYILPLFFGVLNLMFFRIYRNLTLPMMLVLGFMIIRYCVTPILLALEQFPLGLYRIEYDSDSIFYTMVLMVYEMIMLFIGLSINYRNRESISSEEYISRLLSYENFYKLNPLLLFLGIFTIAL